MKDNSDNTNALESNALLACLQIGKILTSTLNLNEILELIMSKVSELIEAQNWSLFLIDERTQELTFVLARVSQELWRRPESLYLLLMRKMIHALTEKLIR